MSRDPSSIKKRVWVALAALVGAGVAARLLVYQLGWYPAPSDPFFGDGTVRVLTLGKSLPVPDAAFGVAAYLAEAVLVAIAGRQRWRTHPRVVYAYAALASGMGFGSAGLIVVQAVIRAFCTLCLVSAGVSLALVIPAVSEARAAWQSRTRA